MKENVKSWVCFEYVLCFIHHLYFKIMIVVIWINNSLQISLKSSDTIFTSSQEAGGFKVPGADRGHGINTQTAEDI